MIRPAFRDALLDRSLTALRLIWAALAAAVVLYVALALWITLTRPPAIRSDLAVTLTPFLYAVAIVAAVLAQWWRRFLAPERLLAGSSRPLAAPTGLTADSDVERRALVALSILQTQSIIIWALADAIGLCGFVISLVTGNPRHAFALAAVALLLLGANAPTRGRLETLLTRIARP
jgi:hypothetical protein